MEIPEVRRQLRAAIDQAKREAAARRERYTIPFTGSTGLVFADDVAAAYEAARRGDIPTIRIGRLLRVPVVALERKLEEAGR